MTQEGVEYTRKKFTLPIELAQRVDELAGKHNGGNSSQFLRSAIRDHARTLAGRDEFAFKKLRQEVEELATDVDTLIEAVEDTQSRSFESSSEAAESERANANNALTQRHVHSTLIESENEAVSLDELANQIDAETLAIQSAVESLLEQDFIQKQTDDELVQYRIQSP